MTPVLYLPGAAILTITAAAGLVTGGLIVYLMMRQQVADADRLTRQAMDDAVDARSDAIGARFEAINARDDLTLLGWCHESAENDNAELRARLRRHEGTT